MARWRIVMVLGLAVCAGCGLVLLSGCGGGDGEDGSGAELPGYPVGLTAESSPRQVAEVLIKALDEEDGEVLLGLVAVEDSAEGVEVIYRRYGKESDRSPAEVAGMTVSGWAMTYAWFQPGATQVTSERVAGDSATVEAQGTNPNTGRPRLLEIEMVWEDGLWKVKTGLQSREL